MQIKSCLIVEDHAQARLWLDDVVSAAFTGVKNTLVANLSQAHDKLDEAYDLALLDIGLPDGSGLDLVAPLTAQGCEVIISSIFGDDSHLVEALKDGAKGYVLKDHPKEELITMLQGILQGRPPLSPQIARRLLDHFGQLGKAETTPTVALTTRERDVLTLLAKGYTIKAVADLLDISHHTTAGYAKTIYRKLNVSSRAEATLEANRLGFVN